MNPLSSSKKIDRLGFHIPFCQKFLVTFSSSKYPRFNFFFITFQVCVLFINTICLTDRRCLFCSGLWESFRKGREKTNGGSRNYPELPGRTVCGTPKKLRSIYRDTSHYTKVSHYTCHSFYRLVLVGYKICTENCRGTYQNLYQQSIRTCTKSVLLRMMSTYKMIRLCTIFHILQSKLFKPTQ